MRALRESLADRVQVVAQVDHVDLAPRRHHRAHRPVAEPHHARDHFPLAGLEHAGVLGFDDQRADFVLGDPLFLLAAVAEQPQQGPAGQVEQHDQR